MNKSSSFEISSETLDKSYKEHDVSDSFDDMFLSDIACCSLNEIKNPVKRKVNELAQLQVKSNLSTKTLQRIIPILNSTPGASIEIPYDKRYLKSNTEKLFEPVYYAKCPSCFELNVCNERCNKCNKIVNKNRNNFFVYLPIEPQLKKSLIDNFSDICEHLKRPRSQFFTDIDDGLVQRTIVVNEQQMLLSFLLNIDGGNLAEKTKKSLWPIQLYQNFIPPEKRFMPENILTVGLFYGDGKPDPFDILFPLIRDFNRLFREGIQVIYDGTQYDFQPVLLHCSCDLPARALIQNFKLYSGTDSCPYCLHPGHRNKENGHIRIRYAKESENSELRTHNQSIENAHRTNNTHGVKGLSCLMALPKFDIIKGVGTDYMHNVLLGCTKRLISIWMGDIKVDGSTFKPMSKQNRAQLNQRLILLKPFGAINYKPRSLEHISLFRAVEFKNLLFFYLRYCLRNLLEKRYIDHFEMLSAAIYLLCKKKVSEEDIQCAENLLNNFCDLFEQYFGKSSITMNIHLLRHYGFVVRNLGPLWAYSCFGFETNMGVLCRYFAGGGDALEQITSKYIISISNRQNSNLEKTNAKLTFIINKNMPSKYNSILEQYELNPNDGIATQITKGNLIFKSIFSKDTKSVDYFFLMNDHTFGVAVFYIKKKERIFVLLNLYVEVNKKFHLTEVVNTDVFKIFPFDSINKKMLYLMFGNTEVITQPPNYYEKS